MMKKQKKSFPVEYYLINDILKKWNPLDISGPALDDEYIKIIPRLLNNIHDKSNLIQIMEEYIKNELGLNYDHYNDKHLKELISVIEKIMGVLKI